MIFNHDGTEFRFDGKDIVNDKTNIIVSTSMAMQLANLFSVPLPKPVIETDSRLDVNYLNSLVKNRVKKD